MTNKATSTKSSKAAEKKAAAINTVVDNTLAPAQTGSATPVAEAAPKVKVPSNTDRAREIWNELLAKRQAGGYANTKKPNWEFRHEFLVKVSETEGKNGKMKWASACGLFNNFKIEAENAEGALNVNGVKVALGRDLKVEVPKEPKVKKAKGEKAAAVVAAPGAEAQETPVEGTESSSATETV